MIAALATISFLATLWFVAVIGLAMLEESGAKILAALRGQSALATQPAIQPIRWKVTTRARTTRPLRAHAKLRAAA